MLHCSFCCANVSYVQYVFVFVCVFVVVTSLLLPPLLSPREMFNDVNIRVRLFSVGVCGPAAGGKMQFLHRVDMFASMCFAVFSPCCVTFALYE